MTGPPCRGMVRAWHSAKVTRCSWNTSQGTTHGVVEEKSARSDSELPVAEVQGVRRRAGYYIVALATRPAETAAHKESALQTKRGLTAALGGTTRRRPRPRGAAVRVPPDSQRSRASSAAASSWPAWPGAAGVLEVGADEPLELLELAGLADQHVLGDRVDVARRARSPCAAVLDRRRCRRGRGRRGGRGRCRASEPVVVPGAVLRRSRRRCRAGSRPARRSARRPRRRSRAPARPAGRSSRGRR